MIKEIFEELMYKIYFIKKLQLNEFYTFYTFPNDLKNYFALC